MKKLTESAKVYFAFFILFALMCAFVKMSINPAIWSEKDRSMVAVLPILPAFVYTFFNYLKIEQ